MVSMISDFSDIHTHILPGCDDGPKSMEESIVLAKCYTNLGIQRVIATPHFIPGTAWSMSKAQVEEKVQRLQVALDKLSIPLQIFSGMEIAFHKKFTERLEDEMFLPLGTSSYYLLEPSFHDSQDMLIESVNFLLNNKRNIILAHPERITSFQDKLKPLLNLISQGLRVQINTGSILGKFGSESKKASMHLIELDCAHYLASDAHNSRTRTVTTLKEWSILQEILGMELMKKLCVTNPAELVS